MWNKIETRERMCVDLTVTSARVHAYMRLVVGSNGMECTEEENFACFFSNNDAYSNSIFKNGSCEFCWRRQTSLQSFHGLLCPSTCYFARRDHETEFVSKLQSRLQLPCIKLLFQVPVAFHCKGTPLAYANTRPHPGNTTNTVSDNNILSDEPLL